MLLYVLYYKIMFNNILYSSVFLGILIYFRTNKQTNNSLIMKKRFRKLVLFQILIFLSVCLVNA